MDSSTLDKKLQGFQLIAQEKFQAILCSIPGKKDLIIEPKLIKSLEHICAASWLKLKGIQRIFKLDGNNAIIRSSPDQVQLYMIRSDLPTFYRVIDQIKLIRKSESNNTDDVNFKYYHVLCIPTCFAYFKQLLEYEGLYGVVELHHYSWDFIHIDEGVLTMELPNLFSSAFMRSDCSLMPSVAHSLRVLHILCGRPPLILTYGKHSENVLQMLEKLGPLPKNENYEDKEPDFAAMIIIDRDKDFASPLLTPATYAGLLMEVFKNNSATLDLDMDMNKIKLQKLPIFTIPGKNDEKKNKSTGVVKKIKKPSSIRLNATHDEIYGDNRYKHFAAASSQIRQQAKSISMELQKLNNMKLDEMHDYVNRKLPKITELKNKLVKHLNASEKVIEMLGSNYRRVQKLEEDILNNVSRKKILADIDELLATDGQMYNTLRLLSLLHICAGISSEELSTFIRNYCNYFGLKLLTVFQNFAHVGLLPPVSEDATASSSTSTPLNKTATKLLSNIPLNIPKFQQTTFQANANRLRLMVSTAGAEDVDNVLASSASFTSVTSSASLNKTDSVCPSYVFNRLYIPLVAQLCSFLLKSSSSDEFTQKLSMVDHIRLNGNPVKTFSQLVREGEIKELLPVTKRNVIVCVVGGITYAEIAACNLVSKITESQIFTATDCILSGGDLISGVFQS